MATVIGVLTALANALLPFFVVALWMLSTPTMALALGGSLLLILVVAKVILTRAKLRNYDAELVVYTVLYLIPFLILGGWLGYATFAKWWGVPLFVFLSLTLIAIVKKLIEHSRALSGILGFGLMGYGVLILIGGGWVPRFEFMIVHPLGAGLWVYLLGTYGAEVSSVVREALED